MDPRLYFSQALPVTARGAYEVYGGEVHWDDLSLDERQRWINVVQFVTKEAYLVFNQARKSQNRHGNRALEA